MAPISRPRRFTSERARRPSLKSVKKTEYDFSGGIRGKYAARYAEGTNVVVLEPDVLEHFPDSRAVNDALRSLVAIVNRQRGRPTKRRATPTTTRPRR